MDSRWNLYAKQKHVLLSSTRKASTCNTCQLVFMETSRLPVLKFSYSYQSRCSRPSVWQSHALPLSSDANECEKRKENSSLEPTFVPSNRRNFHPPNALAGKGPSWLGFSASAGTFGVQREPARAGAAPLGRMGG